MKPRMLKVFFPIAICVVMVGARVGWSAASCPFCNAVGATVTDEVAASKVAILGRCLRVLEPKQKGGLKIAEFELIEALKGGEFLTPEAMFVACIDRIDASDHCLLLAFDCDPLEFGNPTKITAEATTYIQKVNQLPDDKSKRLAFCYAHLMSKDKIVSEDAYNEFARATYDEVKAIGDVIGRDRELIKKTIRDPKTSNSLRSLYWTFLSLCGHEEDAELFHEMVAVHLKQADFNPGLDAAIACYITLKGEAGLKEIASLYFEHPEYSFAQIFPAILAVRVQVQEMKALPRETLAKSLHPLLRRQDIADQVIPDLARWEDWTVLEQIMELFRGLDEEHDYVRTPAIRYLMVCPKKEAKTALDEITKLDPDSVRRAKLIYGGNSSNIP